MRTRLVLPFLLVCAIGGCATSQTSQTTTPLVSLPDGGRISLLVLQEPPGQGPGKGPLAVWKSPDGAQKELTTLVPAPGSPVGLVSIDSSTPRFSSDNTRVWLVRDGKTVASFDYNSGVAILGPAGQPDWARPN